MIYDIIGWIGMVLVLLAYTLLSTNKIKNGILYQLLNSIILQSIDSSFMAIGLFPKMLGFLLLYKLFGL